MRIIFMGTPDFAVASLTALVEHQYNIVAAVTSPDKPAGRGLNVQESAVKKYAIAHHLPVLQPNKLKDPDFLNQLKSYNADLQVVVAFRMLPEVVWNMPPKGTINLHASLLPQYRGAAPINRAIMNGETESGVTTFKLQQKIDTGQIIDQKKVDISKDETAGQLHDRLMTAGAGLLIETVEKVKNNQADFIPQPAATEGLILHSAPKIFKEDCRIDWNQQINTVYNHIRGLSPYPGAWFTLNGKPLKIFEVTKEQQVQNQPAGSIETDNKTYAKITCIGGSISLKKIQPSGKKKMGIEDFLRGFREEWHVE